MILRRRVTRVIVRLMAVIVLGSCRAGSAAAQDDIISRARAEASAGRRQEAIAVLREHLERNPRDVDARLVFGLILSWDGQYDEARTALTQVLAQTPDYLDARVALMNVEWWSGRTTEARELVRSILAVDPGNTQARLVEQRLQARTQPWTAEVSVTVDSFNGDRDAWNETAISLRRQTPAGPVIVRGSRADRFGLHDGLIEVEFYPSFRAGTYAFIGYGRSTDDRLYPDQRLAFDFYQSVGRGFEVSGGFRELSFAEKTHIYLGTLTKYINNWMLTGKVYIVPDERVGASQSYHAQVRRYIGNSGTSFFGGGYGHGFSRDEPRAAGDLVLLDADTVGGQAEVDVSNRYRLLLRASTSRQQQALRTPLWQTTASAGLGVRF